METAKKDIKEKKLSIKMLLLLIKFQLLLDTTLNMEEILLSLKMSKLIVGMLAELSKEEMIIKNQLVFGC